MKLNLNFCYLGQPKSGKSSIINYIFHKMPRKDTLQLQSTKSPEVNVYENSLLRITNLEIPGHIENLNDLSSEYIDKIAEQDVFIYVHDLKFGENQTNTSHKQLREHFKKINDKNPSAHLYILFHQSDLDFLYLGNKVDESINVFKNKFENFISEQFLEKRHATDRCHFHKTSIYDYSINKGKIKSYERCYIHYII